ncbi:MAG: LuxR family transcriptional regulator [Acidobacteriia bacterium]|nr:LuxR family transcriptional regulator [Terriglobia bacterium]
MSSNVRKKGCNQMKTDGLGSGDRTDVGSGTLVLAIGLFAVIASLIGFDVLADYRSGTEPPHLVTEGVVMALALVGLALLWRQFRSVQRRAEQLTVDLESARREAQRFREEAHDALRGLGEAIDRQFTRWALSPAEREVGLLLLKGLSHREIAQVRSTTETTIRQQALALYRKSGLGSRAELSAFFLEDLLLPVGER